MKLPNGERAVVEMAKLLGYCLPRGRNKARVFAAVGIREKDAETLRLALLKAARHGEARLGEPSPYGDRYVIDFEMQHDGRCISIRSSWIIPGSESPPRLTSCYVL
jgi:hypothetical protein